MLHELQNSVITARSSRRYHHAVVLGLRASLSSAIAIPASFLAGILGLYSRSDGQLVVLFSLILA